MRPEADTHTPNAHDAGSATPKDVDERAPVVARAQLEVRAPLETVFAVITDIAAWPSWNPDVRKVSIDGPLAKGTRFRWKAGPSTIVSTLEHVDPSRRVAWTGRTLGIRAIHVYELTPHGDRTLVATSESWDGVLPRLFRAPLARTLQEALASGLGHLRDEAERRARV